MKINIFERLSAPVIAISFLFLIGCNAFSDQREWIKQTSFSLCEGLDCSMDLNISFLDQENTLSYDNTDSALDRCRGRELFFASDLMTGSSCISKEGHFETWHCLVLDQSANFCPSTEPFQITVLVASNDLTLDCKNQTIDHGFEEGTSASNVAIRFPRNRGISNVTIRNCVIQNTGFGAVEIRRDFRGNDHEESTDGHKNIKVENITAINNKLALFIGDRSENITVKDSWFINSRLMPIYIEANSSGTVIENNTIIGSKNREGIAIDSSSNNIVRDNVFNANLGGAILVYHNCGELKGSVCPIERPGSYNNTFLDNVFYENEPLIIASRQGRFYPPGWCTDLAGDSGCNVGDARMNLVQQNLFYIGDSRVSLMIQDGDNIVTGNRFINKSDVATYVPSLGLGIGGWNSSECNSQPDPILDMTGIEVSDNMFYGCNQDPSCQIDNQLTGIATVDFMNNAYLEMPENSEYPLPLELLMSFL